MQGKQCCRQQGSGRIAEQPQCQRPQQCSNGDVLQNAKQMPSPRGQRAQQKTDPHPQCKNGAVKARWASGELRPHVIRKIVPDVARLLNPRISGKAVVVENKLKVQGAAVHREDEDNATQR